MIYVIQISILLFCVIIHEVAHGYVAYLRGDNTAKLLGRLTFNPIPHIDLLGSIVLPLILMILGAPVFGWAKPVPVNPRNFKQYKSSMIMVALAGVSANLLCAIIASVAMFFIRQYTVNDMSVFISLHYILQYVVIINVVLIVLNLLPIPPLDGSRVMFFLLPQKLAYYYAKLEPYGFLIILLLLVTKILNLILIPAINFLTKILITFSF